MAVSYIAQATSSPITGTNTTIVVPSTTAVDDLVLLFVFHRSALTPPDGFISVINVSFSAQGANQYLSIFRTTATLSDIGRTVSLIQNSSGRMSAIINVCRGTNGVLSIAAVDSLTANNVANGGIYPIPSLPAQDSGQLAITVLSYVITSSGSDTSPPLGFTKSYTTSVTDKRLFTAYKNLLFPDSALGSFTGGNVDPQGYATCTIIISETGAITQPLRITQAPLLVIDTSDQPTRVTQAPVLVLDTSPKRVCVTQVPILVLSVPTYPVRVTQSPILIPVIPKPFPKPKVFVPEVPVTEVIEWSTSTAQALDGSEQRNLLRDVPRRSLQLTIVSPDSETRQEMYRLLAKHLKEPVLYPLYHYHEKVSAPSSAGSSRIDFDTRYIDVFAGEQLAIYDPQYEQTYFVGIDTVDVDGVTTTEPLKFDIQSHFIVSSTSSFTVDASATLQMDPVHGVLSMGMISTRKGLLTPQNASSVEIYQGLPILPFRPNTPAAEGFTYRARFTDNGIGPIKIFSDVNFLVIEGPRSFTINRKEDLNKLRKFADLIKGSQKPFYLPTYYDDLNVIERPVNGSNMVKVSNLAYHDLSKTEAWRTLRFETAAGVKYRKVNDSRVVYDSNGQALSLELYLNASLGPNNNDNSVSKVSFMPRVRLTGDRITLTHNEIDTRVEIAVTVVKQ